MKTKKLLVIILSVMLMVCMMPVGEFAYADSGIVASGTCGAFGDNLKWELYSDGALVISGNKAMADYSSYSALPWYSKLNSIKSVEIYNGPKGFVTSIGKKAFQYCKNLTSVSIPNSVTSIGSGAFWGCNSLTSITIPNGITSIEDSVFYACSSLSSISIPNSVTSIGKSAFYGCSSLTDISIPSSVTSIGDGAFENCFGLESIPNLAGVTTIEPRTFRFCYGLTNVSIPNNITSIGEQAFYYCENLTSVTIPNSVTSIGTEAFSYCKNMKCIVYGGDESQWNELKVSLSSVNNAHIQYNSSEHPWNSTYTVDKESTCFEQGVESIRCTYCGILKPGSERALPFAEHSYGDWIESATCTEDGSRERICSVCGHKDEETISALGHDYHETITEPTCTERGYTTYTCSRCEDSYVDNYVDALGHSISHYAAKEPTCTEEGCNEYDACERCDYTTYEAIPALGHDIEHHPGKEATCTEGGWDAYDTCKRCDYTTFELIPVHHTWGTEYTVDKEATYLENGSKSIHCSICDAINEETITAIPKISESATIVASGTFGTDGDNLVWTLDDEGVLAITGEGNMPDYQYFADIPWYSQRSNIKSIFIGEGVTNIGEYVFRECRNTTSVTIPNSVTRIGSSAFDSCTKLTSLEIPEGVTSIEDRVFYLCTSLSSITIPSSVTSIDATGLFYGCKNLTRIDVDDNNSIFYSIDGVLYSKTKNSIVKYPNAKAGSYIVPDSITSIGSSAFYECVNLTDITFNDNLTIIESSAFAGCKSLTSIVIPDSVTTIRSQAFRECTNLKSITLPDNLKVIDEAAFYDCTSLTAITIPEGISCLSQYTFYGCSNLESISIPSSMRDVQMGVFHGCSKLKSVYISDLKNYLNISYSIDTWNIPPTALPVPTYYGADLYLNGELLTELIIPENVNSIASNALYNCKSIKSIYIPKGFTSIGSNALYGCSNLANINVNSNNTNYFSLEGILCNKKDNSIMLCPAGKKGDLIIPDDIKIIGASAFSMCSGITSMTIKGVVTSIGNYAFSGCSSLETIFVPCDSQSTANYINDNRSTIGLSSGCAVEMIHKDEKEGDINPKPTCTTDGAKNFICSGCGAVIRTEPIPAIGHEWGEWTVTTQPTCIDKGVETRYCKHDPSHTDTRELQATGIHTWNKGIVTTKPTCYATGIKTYTCTVCKATRTESVPATGHDWGEWTITTKPNCISSGIETRYCKNDPSHTETRTVPKTGVHTWDNGTVVTEPGCETEGAITYTCTVCNATKEEVLPALGHDFAETVVEPTKTEGGYTKHECKRCGYTYIDNETEPLWEQVTFSSSHIIICSECTKLLKLDKGTRESLTWKSSNTSIAKVSNDGTVTALKPGKVTITASNEKYSDKMTVEIKDYAYLAAADDRRVHREYNTATTHSIRAYAYDNSLGEHMVLTYVSYKIKTNWEQWTLHNMTTGAVYTDPDGYYDALIDRAFGAQKYAYMGAKADMTRAKIEVRQGNCRYYDPNLADGTTHKVNGNTYKVISESLKTVSFNKSKNAKSVTVPATVKIRNRVFNVTTVDAKSFTASKIRTVTIGKNVKKIKKNAFKGSKATKIILKTKLLKKTTVKGCLLDSKVKTVKVSVGTSADNKKYVKSYKKIFTKSNAGRKVTVQ